MRVLVLTNHFADFYGSEIVALEVAQWFSAAGDSVTLAANYIADPIQAHAEGIALSRSPETVELSLFDLIWCQHDVVGALPLAAFEKAAKRGRLPHVALVSLSPHEPYEQVDGVLARALDADVLVNSEETRREQLRRAHGAVGEDRVHCFYNAAPLDFWRTPKPEEAVELKSVLVISNHTPPEVLEALEVLTAAGIETRRIGAGAEKRLVRPADIADASAIITIGKSVVYAIVQSTPVYMYDHFGGDGWLTRENFTRNQAHNFSGRPVCTKRTGVDIAREITEGFATAHAEARLLGEVGDLRLLALDRHLAALRARAEARIKAWLPADPLTKSLARAEFRAHLENSRAKHEVMKRAYLAGRRA